MIKILFLIFFKKLIIFNNHKYDNSYLRVFTWPFKLYLNLQKKYIKILIR